MVKSVDNEPEVTIVKWGIMQDPVGFRIVGIHAGTRQGRVTSPIVEFDEHARTARTASGRLYHLSGEPNDDVAAVLIRDHARRWGLTVFDVALAEPSEIALALAPRPQGGLN